VATTLTRIRPGSPGGGNDLRLEPTGKRRRPLLAIGSIVLVAASVAAFTSAYLRAGHKESVLEVTAPVSQGQILSADDLAPATLSVSSGVSVVPATAASSVIGRRVSVPLVPGTLLADADLDADAIPPPGNAVVGIALKAGQMPAAGVSPGDAVDIVLTGSPGSPDTASVPAVSAGPPVSGPVSGPGTVLAPGVLVTDVATPSASSGSDTFVVSVIVARALAPIVASASAAGQAALVVVNTRS
jgi:hypothetical protein